MPEELSRTLLYAAASFRLGMEGAANEQFARSIDLLLAHLATHPEAAEQLQPILPEILAAQGRADTLRVADLVEYEVVPKLR